jgi:hypothetical protein
MDKTNSNTKWCNTNTKYQSWGQIPKQVDTQNKRSRVAPTMGTRVARLLLYGSVPSGCQDKLWQSHERAAWWPTRAWQMLRHQVSQKTLPTNTTVPVTGNADIDQTQQTVSNWHDKLCHNSACYGMNTTAKRSTPRVWAMAKVSTLPKGRLCNPKGSNRLELP